LIPSKHSYTLHIKSFLPLLVFVLVLITLSALSLTYGAYSQHNLLSEANVYGNQSMGRQRLQDLLEAHYNQPLSEIDIPYMQSKFMVFPLIRDVKISKSYPNQINIHLRESNPIAYLRLDKFYCYGDDGRLLPLPDKGMIYNLPILSGISGRPTNKIAEDFVNTTADSLRDILTLIRKDYPSIYTDISEISFQKNKHVELVSALYGTLVRLGPTETIEEKLAILNEFNRAKEKGKTIGEYEYIDIRFKHQLIVKERNS
jgi:cell division septal protein FtsQ